MESIHMEAAKAYITSLNLDKDHTVRYKDLDNDGVKISYWCTINQYRDSDPIDIRVRNGEIYYIRSNGKKGRLISTY